MRKIKLNKYERDLLEAYEADEFVSVMTPESKKEVQEVAKNTFKKDNAVSWSEVRTPTR